MKCTVPILIGLVIMGPVVSLAWQENGVVVCDDTSSQSNPVIASDNSNGAIITWVDHRNGNYDIYAQRVDSSGIRQWISGSDSNGVIICDETGYQHKCKILADGFNGGIIIWQDKKVSPNDWDIYAQKVNSSGERQWSPLNGILAWDGWIEINHEIVSDGSGGAIITYRDESPYKIYAQKITSSGILEWGAGAKIVSDVSEYPKNPKVSADGTGGAIIVWWDERQVSPDTSYDIYAQKIDSDGNRQWGSSDLCVCSKVNDQQDSRVISDGSGGAIIVWDDDIYGNGSYYKVYAQRVNSSGTLEWGPDGICICDEISVYPEIIADDSDGDIIIWQDYRSGSNLDIYAQRINSSGELQWEANGVPICNAVGNQSNHKVIADGFGGAIVTWDDQRDGRHDIYGQRVDNDGSIHSGWALDGVLVCDTTNAGFGIYPRIVADGSGGAIITWQDTRNPDNNSDIYAQRITADGTVGMELEPANAPDKIFLNIPSSNPTAGNIEIRYGIVVKRDFISSKVALKIFDVSGTLIRKLVDEEKKPGKYSIRWDGKNENGDEVRSGIYFCYIDVGGLSKTRKIIMLK
jgi:hypothetical protein